MVIFVWLFLTIFISNALCQDELVKSDQWYQINGKMIDISAKGQHLWAISCNNTLHKAELDSDGNFLKWNTVSGPKDQKLISVSVSDTGSVWVIAEVADPFTIHSTYRYNKETGAWVGPWGGLMQISAYSDSVLVGSRSRGETGELYYSNQWSYGSGAAYAAFPGTGRWVAIGKDETRYMVDMKNRLNRFNSATNKWEFACVNSAATVDVYDADRAIITTQSGRMSLWNGNNWRVLPGNAFRATISEKFVYHLNELGETFLGVFE
jgi:hypothetical protein